MGLPFTGHNYYIFAAGIVVLILGYIFLSIEPADSFWSLKLAPIVLIIGYLILIPASFLYQHASAVRSRSKQTAESIQKETGSGAS